MECDRQLYSSSETSFTCDRRCFSGIEWHAGQETLSGNVHLEVLLDRLMEIESLKLLS
jgi:hypothetical protein